MDSIKMHVRSLVVEKKKQFNKTNDHKYVIEAAVIKGVYCGIGGSKVIPLPSYCSIISNIVAYIVKAKTRFNGDLVKDIEKLSTYILKNLDGVTSIELDITKKKPLIALSFKNTTVAVNVSLPLTNKDIATIGNVIIKNLSDKYVFSEDELKIITDTLEAYLYYIDRRF